MDAYSSVVGDLGVGGPVGWPRMNFEMHLHLNSELASNEFLTDFADTHTHHHHHSTTTTPVFPGSPVSSTVCGDEV